MRCYVKLKCKQVHQRWKLSYLTGLGGHSWAIQELAVQQLCVEEPQVEGPLCLLCWQYLNIAIVDELQHGTEEARHLSLAGLLCNNLEAHRLSLSRVIPTHTLQFGLFPTMAARKKYAKLVSLALLISKIKFVTVGNPWL